MRLGMTIKKLAAPCVALLCALGGSLAQADVAIDGAALWQWPLYGPYAGYPYGAVAPWVPCAPWTCVDANQLRRDLRREMRSQELRRELELRASGGLRSGTESLFGTPRYIPPSTPAAQVQPRYRGSGEVRPQYHDANQPR
jgi:uncharacterized membrane protein